MKFLWLSGLCAIFSLHVRAQSAGWEAALTRFNRDRTEQTSQPVNARFFEKTVEKPAPSPSAPAWEAETLPFFCRIEHRINRKTPLPVFFRLGSLEYVNSLEQKPGY